MTKTCETVAGIVTSPLGNWTVEACQNGLHLVKLSKEVTDDNFLTLGTKAVQLTNSSVLLKPFEDWMKCYFSAKDDMEKVDKKLKICSHVADKCTGNFRQIVWLTLRNKVKFGQTTSYGKLGEMATQKPGLGRAVGTAMANNPISLVVPCHRVVKANGQPGNYSKCTKNKG